jgi:hypothetical protein
MERDSIYNVSMLFFSVQYHIHQYDKQTVSVNCYIKIYIQVLRHLIEITVILHHIAFFHIGELSSIWEYFEWGEMIILVLM